MTIRVARPMDAARVQAIYAPNVRDTAISFELEPPTVDEMAGRIAKTLEAGLPWLVHDAGDGALGYVYAGRHRGERPAYRWTVEVSVYVHGDARGRGVARGLYTSLFAALALLGYRTALAGATLPNAASVALHEGLGFRRIGVFPAVGYKFGTWYDVVWWSRPIGGAADPPSPPRPVQDVLDDPAWRAALAAGDGLIRPGR